MENSLDFQGVREDGTLKGDGFFGKLPMSDGYATEISVNIDGVEAPTINPFQPTQQLTQLLTGEEPSEEAIQNTAQWAAYRTAQGKSPFYEIGDLKGVTPDMMGISEEDQGVEGMFDSVISGALVDGLNDQKNRAVNDLLGIPNSPYTLFTNKQINKNINKIINNL